MVPYSEEELDQKTASVWIDRRFQSNILVVYNCTAFYVYQSKLKSRISFDRPSARLWQFIGEY
ncbi:hypothetical protein D3C87_124840 [compost metagenome]